MAATLFVVLGLLTAALTSDIHQASASTIYGPQITLPFTGLSDPYQLAVDPGGDVYVADQYNGRIAELPVGGSQQTPITNLCSTNCINPGASGVAVDSNGDIFSSYYGFAHGSSNWESGFVEEVSRSGTQQYLPMQACCVSNDLWWSNLAFDGSGNMYALGGAGGYGLWKVNNLGGGSWASPQELVNSNGGSISQLVSYGGDEGLAADSAGDLFIGVGVTTYSCPYDYCSATGTQTVAELPGGSTTNAILLPFKGLKLISSVALDSAGDVFVADQQANDVVELTAGGTQITLPFSGLNAPNGVAVDGAGDVFVADGHNNRVVELPVQQVPNSPTNVVAAATDGQAVVTWTAPTNDTAAIQKYVVVPSAPCVTGACPLVVTASKDHPPPTTATFNGLVNANAYTFTVYAATASANGPASSPSNSVSPSLLTSISSTVTLAAPPDVKSSSSCIVNGGTLCFSIQQNVFVGEDPMVSGSPGPTSSFWVQNMLLIEEKSPGQWWGYPSAQVWPGGHEQCFYNCASNIGGVTVVVNPIGAPITFGAPITLTTQVNSTGCPSASQEESISFSDSLSGSNPYICTFGPGDESYNSIFTYSASSSSSAIIDTVAPTQSLPDALSSDAPELELVGEITDPSTNPYEAGFSAAVGSVQSSMELANGLTFTPNTVCTIPSPPDAVSYTETAETSSGLSWSTSPATFQEAGEGIQLLPDMQPCTFPGTWEAPSAVVGFQTPGASLRIATTTLPVGEVRRHYSTAISVMGGNPPYKWSLLSGSLPGGLHLKKTGVISGRPKKADSGTYIFTVKVVDKKIKVKHHPATQDTATQRLSITIANSNQVLRAYEEKVGRGNA